VSTGDRQQHSQSGGDLLDATALVEHDPKDMKPRAASSASSSVATTTSDDALREILLTTSVGYRDLEMIKAWQYILATVTTNVNRMRDEGDLTSSERYDETREQCVWNRETLY
jgi:hypothetical protein